MHLVRLLPVAAVETVGDFISTEVNRSTFKVSYSTAVINGATGDLRTLAPTGGKDTIDERPSKIAHAHMAEYIKGLVKEEWTTACRPRHPLSHVWATLPRGQLVLSSAQQLSESARLQPPKPRKRKRSKSGP